jgi:hypothetical protein
MYASPASLLRFPPPRKSVIRGKFAPDGRGRPEAGVWLILVALFEWVNRGELRLRASDAGERIPPRGEMPDFTLYHS